MITCPICRTEQNDPSNQYFCTLRPLTEMKSGERVGGIYCFVCHAFIFWDKDNHVVDVVKVTQRIERGNEGEGSIHRT